MNIDVTNASWQADCRSEIKWTLYPEYLGPPGSLGSASQPTIAPNRLPCGRSQIRRKQSEAGTSRAAAFFRKSRGMKIGHLE